MEIQFLKKMPPTNDGIRLSYSIDGKNIYLEVSGTAMSVYEIYNLPDNELGMIFIPVITDIYSQLKDQGAEIESIDIDSDGAKVEGKIIYVKEAIEEVLKRGTRKVVNGEYWEILKNETGDGKPYKVYNTHQAIYEKNGSHNPDCINSFTYLREAINFLWK
jgi:hypothetical protein